jgi:hypothetical protein
MKLFIYSIYDTAAGIYNRPMFCHSDGQALRIFEDISNDKEHEVGRHPKDYSLWRIGVYNDADAKIIGENKECLTTGLEAVSNRISGKAEEVGLHAVGGSE